MRNKLLFILFSCPLVVFGQEKLKYTYDDSGNRIKREIVISTTTEILSTEPVVLTGENSKRMIRNYSDLSGERVYIEISDFKTIKDGIIELCNTSGIPCLTQKIKKQTEEIDLSNKPAGVYMLHITIDNETTTRKILKK